MKMSVRALAAAAALSVALLGFGAAGAGASPSNAPTAQMGTFSCPDGSSGTFVVNSGKNHAAQTWDVAHLTFSSGATGIFVPTALDFTITFNGQTFTSSSTKGSAPGSTTCSISESGPGFTLSGTATGKITITG